MSESDFSERPAGVSPPAPGMVWQPWAFGGGQWVYPQVVAVRLSDEDVQRIALAVVGLLKMDRSAIT